MERKFTEHISEENLKEFGEMLMLNPKAKSFHSYRSGRLLDDGNIKVEMTDGIFVFTDFELVRACRRYDWGKNLDANMVNLLNSAWAKFVYNSQKTPQDKKAYKEAYHEYIDSKIFNKECKESKRQEECSL